jgi:hypothetical protein
LFGSFGGWHKTDALSLQAGAEVSLVAQRDLILILIVVCRCHRGDDRVDTLSFISLWD